MRWLFRFNVGEERRTGSKELAQGFGHGMRCLSLAQTFQQRYAGEVLLLIQGDRNVGNYFDNLGIPFVLNRDEQFILDDYRPTVIVADINHLAPEQILWYRCWAPVVNLAPRGLPKFYADVTFNAIAALDMPCPAGISKVAWFRGPEYAIVGQNFIRLREQLGGVRPRWDKGSVVVCMGGVDYHNLTGTVVRSLCPWYGDVGFKIIVGPFYPHEAELKQLLADQGLPSQLLRDPPNIAREIVEAGLGIFGAGVITYEALSVGVPSINVGLTPFHRLVGEELSTLGVGVYAGSHEELGAGSRSELVSGILADHIRLNAMRRRGLELVDGLGAQRIVDKIVQMFG